MAITRRAILPICSVNQPSPEHRSTTVMPPATPTAASTLAGSGQSASHHPAVGISVPWKKPGGLDMAVRSRSTPSLSPISLARLREWIENAVMKRIVASLWVCWAAYCGAQSNTFPLAFGMTPGEAQAALGVPLVYHSGRPGSEIYLASARRAFPASIRPNPCLRCSSARAISPGGRKTGACSARRLSDGRSESKPQPTKFQVVPLSILDLSPVAAGSSGAQSLRNSLDLARLADGLGYTRYWVAEHHNLPSIASSAPDIMIGQIAAATTRMRVGSGGVMLPNHAPLMVAERFKVLEALFPGRIDLGLGRAPGTDPVTSYALRRRQDSGGDDDFLQRFQELVLFESHAFPENHPFRSIRAMPEDVALPPIWLLGSSGYSAQLAALVGAGYSFAHHFA